MLMSSKHDKIIEILCKYMNISKDEMFKILKDKECRYILFLLLKKYRCLDIDVINNYFPNYSKKSLNYNYKKAEEKLFINREFRRMYFEIEDDIEKTL